MLTLDSLAEDVNRLRRAKRFQYFHNKGIVLDQREHEALEIQVKAVDMGLQVQGFCTQLVPQLCDVGILLQSFTSRDLCERFLRLTGGSFEAKRRSERLN